MLVIFSPRGFVDVSRLHPSNPLEGQQYQQQANYYKYHYLFITTFHTIYFDT